MDKRAEINSLALNDPKKGRYVIVCDHASNWLPREYSGLGLGDVDLARAIAWDIGAAVVAEMLALRLESPVFLAPCSRLLIDCNRPIGSSGSIPAVSDNSVVPGNLNLSPRERRHRETEYFWPYHMRIKECLDYRRAHGMTTWLIAIHSFSPFHTGEVRPWHVGFTYGSDSRLAKPLIQRYQKNRALRIGDNEPYPITASGDYTLLEHGQKRGIPNVLIEIRQDLVTHVTGARTWASSLASELEKVSLQDEEWTEI